MKTSTLQKGMITRPLSLGPFIPRTVPAKLSVVPFPIAINRFLAEDFSGLRRGRSVSTQYKGTVVTLSMHGSCLRLSQVYKDNGDTKANEFWWLQLRTWILLQASYSSRAGLEIEWLETSIAKFSLHVKSRIGKGMLAEMDKSMKKLFRAADRMLTLASKRPWFRSEVDRHP